MSDETLDLENAPFQEVRKPNPDLLNLIKTIVESMYDTNPDVELMDIVYPTTKAVLRNPKFRSQTESMIPLIFVYYIDVYSRILKERDETTRSDSTYMNKSVISIFDLYLSDVRDHTIRHMLVMAAKAIHEVITNKIAYTKEISTNEAMSRLSTLAMFTETVSFYFASTRRRQNIKYMSWLADFLSRCLQSEDLGLIDDNDDVKSILTQVMNKETIIRIPKQLH